MYNNILKGKMFFLYKLSRGFCFSFLSKILYEILYINILNVTYL